MGKTALAVPQMTNKQRMFLAEYLLDYNATRAAKMAGYKCPQQAGAKLTSSSYYPVVAKAIQQAQKQALSCLAVSQERILQELEWLALRDPLDMCDEKGRIIMDDLRRIPARMRRCMDAFKVKRTYHDDGRVEDVAEVKLSPKLPAVELLMKHMGLLGVKNDLSHSAQQVMDWDGLLEKGKIPDRIEQHIQKS